LWNVDPHQQQIRGDFVKQLIVLLSFFVSLAAQAASVEFKCTAYSNYYHHYEVNFNIQMPIQTYAYCVPGYTCYDQITEASRQYVNSYISSTCVAWAQASLNSLATSVLPIGGWATVYGGGYAHEGYTGYPVSMATTTVYKTAAPSFRIPIESCGGYRYGRIQQCR
jgi:hypothetical protein